MSRTTITIPTALIDELMPLVHAKTKTEAAIIALKEEVRRKKIERIKAAAGTIEFTMTADEMRHGDHRLG